MKKTTPPITKADLPKIIAAEPTLRTGPMGLWLAVFIDTFLTARDGKDPLDVALAWKFISEDPVVEILGLKLGLGPGELKRLVLGALG